MKGSNFLDGQWWFLVPFFKFLVASMQFEHFPFTFEKEKCNFLYKFQLVGLNIFQLKFETSFVYICNRPVS